MVEVTGAAEVANNSLLVINPYKDGGIWMFDDDRIQVKRELFVGDINRMIDLMVIEAGIKKAHRGFRAIFSAMSFPGAHMRLVRKDEPEEDEGFLKGLLKYFSPKECEEMMRPQSGANYDCPQYGLTGWLCPVLFLYFEEAPEEIYVRAEPLQ